MVFAEVPFNLSPSSHLTFGHQHSGRYIINLQEHDEQANSSVNTYYYEKMFKSTQFYDDTDGRCDYGSLLFVDGDKEKNLVWQVFGNDLVLQEMDLKSAAQTTTTTTSLVIKSPENSYFLPGTSIKPSLSGIIIWLLSSNRTLYCLHINKMKQNSNSCIDGFSIENLKVDSFKIGVSDQEIEGSYNRLQQKSIFSGLFGNASQDRNNIEFFKAYSEHFPTCLCAIDSHAVIVGLSNGNLIRIIRNGSNFVHNTFIFETSSWSWFSNTSVVTSLEQVFKNLTVSVQHLSLYENQLNIIVSLHRDGTLLVWKEDSDTIVSIGGEMLPANNLKLLKLLQQAEDGIESVKFCSLPLKIYRGSDDSTFQIIYSNSQNDQTQFVVLGFQTCMEESSFSITYNGIENTKYFSSEFLPEDIFPIQQQREKKYLSSKLVNYSLLNGTLWSIWSVRDYSPRMGEDLCASTLSYAVSYGSLLNESCQPSAWCFVRTLHSQLSSGVSKFYGNTFGDSKHVGLYVEQFLFASSIKLLLNPDLLLRSLVSFYPKEELHSLTQELGITQENPQIPYSYVNEAFWSEKIKNGIEYTVSQKKAKIVTSDLLERNVQESKIEIQTWQEFLQNLVQIWSTLNHPMGLFFIDNQSTPILMYSQPIASLLRKVDTLEFAHQTSCQSSKGNRNYLLVANNLQLKDTISSKSTFAKDLVEFFRILNFVDRSVCELVSTFTVLPLYFSQSLSLDNPSTIARNIAVELVSGLSPPNNNNINLSDTLIKDQKQNRQKKLFVTGLLDRIASIRSTSLPSILNFVLRSLLMTESPRELNSTPAEFISMQNPLIVQILNASSIQILESRYQVACQLCIFIEITRLINAGIDFETKNCYSLLKSYHLAWWLSNRSVEANPHTLNLVTSLSNSKLNMSDFFFTHSLPTSHTRYAIEMLLSENDVIRKLRSCLPQHSDHSSLSKFVTIISLAIIQHVILVEHESTIHFNAIETAQYLLNWQAFNTLKRYCLLLQSCDSSFPLSYHFLALSNLQEGDLSQAKKNFLRCAIIGVSNRERSMETLRLFELMNIYWKVEPNVVNNQQNELLVKSSLLFYYYNCIRQLCEKHPELSLEFANLALTEADSDVVPPEEISILYSVLFSLSLHFERFDMAYVALNSQNDVQRKRLDLRKFVGSICDLAAYNSEQCKYFGNMLCELPFSGNRNDVNDLLHERAKYSDLSIRLSNVGTSSSHRVKVLHTTTTTTTTNGRSPSSSLGNNMSVLEEHQQKLDTVFTYYHLLYSYNIHRGDYNKAAMYTYELGRRIDSQIRMVPFSAVATTSNDCNGEILEAYLQKQTECFLISLNALKIVSESNQWFLYPYDDEQTIERATSPLKRVRGNNDQMQVVEMVDSTLTKPGIITLSNLEKRYHLSASKLFILQSQKKNPSPSFNMLSLVLLNNPIDIISQFLSGNYESVEKAFMIASSCNFTTSEMCILFSKFTKKCCESGDIHTGGMARKMWNLLKLKMAKHNNASTGYLFASSAVRAIYQELHNGFITREEPFLPDWLVKQCDPNALLRIYLEFGKIVEAQKLLMQRSSKYDSSPLFTLPISQTLIEYVVKQ